MRGDSYRTSIPIVLWFKTLNTLIAYSNYSNIFNIYLFECIPFWLSVHTHPKISVPPLLFCLLHLLLLLSFLFPLFQAHWHPCCSSDTTVPYAWNIFPSAVCTRSLLPLSNICLNFTIMSYLKLYPITILSIPNLPLLLYYFLEQKPLSNIQHNLLLFLLSVSASAMST